MKTLQNTLTCLILLFLFACTYEPDEIYSKEVIQPDHSVNISLNTYNDGDTIHLYEPANFDFEVSTDPGSIEEVRVIFEGREIKRSATPTGSFSLGSVFSQTGNFELIIQFLSKSGSGSYADHAGAEKFEAWRKWIVNIDLRPPPKPSVTVTEENGFLKLTWTPCDKPNFLKYVVRTGSDIHAVITDAHQNTWIDSSYFGGTPVEYRVGTYVSAFGSRSGTGIVAYDDSFGVSIDYNASDSTANIAWEKAPYGSALESYEILEDDVLRHTVTNAADTTVKLKLNVIWNKTTEIKVRYNARYSSNTVLVKATVINRNPFPRMMIDPAQLDFNATLNAFIGYRNNYLVIFNTALQPLDSLPASPVYDVPFTGPFIYYGVNNTIVQHNLQTKETKTLDIVNLSNEPVFPQNIHSSSNGLVSYFFVQSGYHSRVYSFVNDTFLEMEDYQYGDPPVNPTLSNEGTYAYNWNKAGWLRTVNSDVLERHIGNIGYNAHGFREDSENEIITDKAIYEISTSNYRADPTIPMYYTIIDYDPTSYYLLYAKSGLDGLRLVHIDSYDTKIVPAFYSQNNKYRLIGGYLFDAEGYYVKVF